MRPSSYKKHAAHLCSEFFDPTFTLHRYDEAFAFEGLRLFWMGRVEVNGTLPRSLERMPVLERFDLDTLTRPNGALLEDQLPEGCARLVPALAVSESHHAAACGPIFPAW